MFIVNYLVVLVVQPVQLVLACMRRDQVPVLFLLQRIVELDSGMVECPVEDRVDQVLPEFQGYRVDRVFQPHLVVRKRQLNLGRQLPLLEFHQEVG